VADVEGQDGEDGEAVTAAAFGRLLYTDCAPGTGCGSGGGFQIQAQSPGVDPQQASFAVGWLLYEAQNAWVADRRPIEDFPLGFAHSGAEGYGTAQGRYVGKEAVGGRMGNHLADCLLTHDPELYGTIRPAQLWRAPLWRAEPWETRDCPDFDGDLELGPLGLEDITDWVREKRAERGPVLARLLSVLEDPNGQRVVIVSADADEAMRWIAAATLLLPQRQALDVSIKVFSGGPLRSLQRVVAAPPDIFRDLRPGAGLGVFVLDAASCRADEASVTERAQFLVGKFAGEADPYDIVDATDLAHELSGGAWPQDVAAVLAAWSLTRPGDPVSDPDSLFRWLREAGRAQLREHGPAVTETLLAGNPSADQLRWLDAQITSGELEFDLEAIRIRLLDAEIADALGGQAAPEGTLPGAALSDQARRDAESALTSALLRSADGKVDMAEANLVLRLARRHGISLDPPSPPVEQFVTDFVWAWLNSSKPLDPKDWAMRERIVAAAQTELRDLYTDDPSSKVVRGIIVRFVAYFTDLKDPADPLYWQKQAIEIRQAADEQKDERLRQLLNDIAKWRKTNPGQADRAEKDLQQALLDWNAVTEAIAVVISAEISESRVKDEIKDKARSWLTDKASQPDADFLRVLRVLHNRSPFPPSSRLGELAEGDKKVELFLRHASGEKARKDSGIDAVAKALSKADDAVIVIRVGDIVDAISANADLAVAVLMALPAGTAIKPRKAIKELVRRLRALAAQPMTLDERVEFAVWLVEVLNPLPDGKYKQLYEVLKRLHEAISNGKGGARESDRWVDEVRKSLPDDLANEWDRLTYHLTGRRRR
jgi:hypothetical protein